MHLFIVIKEDDGFRSLENGASAKLCDPLILNEILTLDKEIEGMHFGKPVKGFLFFEKNCDIHPDLKMQCAYDPSRVKELTELEDLELSDLLAEPIKTTNNA